MSFNGKELENRPATTLNYALFLNKHVEFSSEDRERSKCLSTIEQPAVVVPNINNIKSNTRACSMPTYTPR